MSHRAPPHRIYGPRHRRTRRHDLPARDETRPQRELPLSSCRDLVENRLIYRKRDGRRKRVASSDARAVEVYQDLVRQHSHIDFPELVLSLSDQSRRRRCTPRGCQSPERFPDSYRGRRRRCGRHGVSRLSCSTCSCGCPSSLKPGVGVLGVAISVVGERITLQSFIHFFPQVITS